MSIFDKLKNTALPDSLIESLFYRRSDCSLEPQSLLLTI